MIPEEETPPADNTPLEASFRDPSGVLFYASGRLYRQVNRVYQEHYTRLMDSGLYQNLVDAGYLIPHKEVDVAPVDPGPAWIVIQPEVIDFISYPYEWCFSQLKDAALLTLHIQKRALEHGMWLKDSSAYNIQFQRGLPTLIDSLSFEIYTEGQPWVAYRQFCQHFLAPLALMARRDVRLGQLARIYIDGVPLDLASRLLPWRTRLELPLLLHVHLHAASQQRFAGQVVRPESTVSKNAMLGLVDSLESAVRRLKWSPGGTAWGDYYDTHNYTPAALEHKSKLVTEFLAGIQPRTVWDLGANTGRFSRIAAEAGIPTLSFDIDPGAVEGNYLQCRRADEQYILPLLLDLTNPSPGLGWHNRERLPLLERGPADAVLALALVHHLAIANNVPLERIASFLQQCGRWLVIEFVPKQDPQVQRLLVAREDIFPDYTPGGFLAAFSRYFTIHRTEALPESKRVMYLMERI